MKATSLSQSTIERVLKACKRAGHDKARIHINLAQQTIDICLGENPSDSRNSAGNAFDEWVASEKRQGRHRGGSGR